VKSSKEYRQLQAENDSLRIESLRSTAELDEAVAVLDEVENDMRTIREAESFLTLPKSGGELSLNKREELKQNMQLVTQIIQKNKQQISELQEKLRKGNGQIATLRKTIERLSEEISQKAQMITDLQANMEKQHIHIQELSEAVESLTLTTLAQSGQIGEQDKTLHTAYYCFGTAKELKDQKILTSAGLFAKPKVLEDSFSRDYFISIDIRQVHEIPLYTPKATLRSSHPAGSYRFAEDEEGNLTFHITNVEQFWSLGKYLVIQVR
jgi:myosin heavy subunit